jgi:hypothetical protein
MTEAVQRMTECVRRYSATRTRDDWGCAEDRSTRSAVRRTRQVADCASRVEALHRLRGPLRTPGHRAGSHGHRIALTQRSVAHTGAWRGQPRSSRCTAADVRCASGAVACTATVSASHCFGDRRHSARHRAAEPEPSIAQPGHACPPGASALARVRTPASRKRALLCSDAISRADSIII